MADTSHVHTNAPVEGDGVNYRGIVWFVAILVATTVFCQVLVWGMFKVMQYRAEGTDAVRAPLSTPALTVPAPPNLLSLQIQNPDEAVADPDPGGLLAPDEPGNLKAFRAKEDALLNSYGWVDKNAGVVEIPIDRAKALVLDPARNTFPARPEAAASGKAGPAAAVATGKKG